jgi:Holliday junction resolvase-like predicted endonuclease
MVKKADIDWSSFPAESLAAKTLGLCLACALDVLTRHVGLSPTRAMSEIKKYTPGLPELTAESPSRPYLAWPAATCPFCGAAAKWHSPLKVVKIEGGKATDAPRRALVQKLGAGFVVVEEKSTERDALYSWLAKIGEALNLDSATWMMEAAKHWLGRRLPKEDWRVSFQTVRFVRRSRELTEDAFKIAGPALLLAPLLFDEILLIQYLLSRSHKAGGRTFEGRVTLKEIFQRLRGGGYLRSAGISTSNPAEALEQFLEIQGGEGRVKFHYVIDRRDLLARLAALKGVRVPRPKL